MPFQSTNQMAKPVQENLLGADGLEVVPLLQLVDWERYAKSNRT